MDPFAGRSDLRLIAIERVNLKASKGKHSITHQCWRNSEENQSFWKVNFPSGLKKVGRDIRPKGKGGKQSLWWMAFHYFCRQEKGIMLFWLDNFISDFCRWRCLVKGWQGFMRARFNRDLRLLNCSDVYNHDQTSGAKSNDCDSWKITFWTLTDNISWPLKPHSFQWFRMTFTFSPTSTD